MDGNFKTVGIILIVVLGVALAASLAWGIYEAVRLYKGKHGKKHHHKTSPGTSMSNGGFVGAAMGGGGGGATAPVINPSTRMAVAGEAYTTDSSSLGSDLRQGGCFNENMVGAVFPSESQRGASTACSFPRGASIGSKPVPLASQHLSRSSLGKSTRVDLSAYSSLSADQAVAAQGLDSPTDLALASALIGHTSPNLSTATVCTGAYCLQMCYLSISHVLHRSSRRGGWIVAGGVLVLISRRQVGPWLRRQDSRGRVSNWSDLRIV